MAKRAKKGSKEKATTLAFKTKSSAKFVSFSFGATIPTQAFGNVTPRIEVTAASYEDARDFAIPRIQALYERFCDVRPVFLGKITETVVNVAAPAPEKKEEVKEKVDPEKDVTPTKPKTEAVLKAEKAIGLAMSEDAINAIQDQIERSVKIAAEDKPALYTICLKKKKELKK